MKTTFLTQVKLMFLIVAAASLLDGCGSASTTADTSGSTSVQTISGTVSDNAALSGVTVTVKDSTGSTMAGTTNSAGVYSINVSGMTPPFMLVTTNSANQNMYSALPAMDMATTNTKNVNITPVTTLVMYEINSETDPSSMYNTISFTSLTAGAISAKEVAVRAILPANTVNTIFSMMYGQFLASASDTTGYFTALGVLGSVQSFSSSGVTLGGGSGGTVTYRVGSGGSGTVGGTPTVTLVLRNTADTTTVNSLDSSTPRMVKATVRDANGAAVAGAIVTFTTSDTLGGFSGGANTALTGDGTNGTTVGVAKVTLTTSNASGGAATVTASTTVASVAATSTLNYSIGSAATTPITLSTLTLPVGTLSAYGTASISVDVMQGLAKYTATPLTVNFASACASAGKATITSSVTTVNGTAAASYLDNGCNNPTTGDSITATLQMNGSSSTGNLPIGSPSIGSIQFVSVSTNPVTTPPMIAIKGTGGVGRSETAHLVFRVVDSAGNPFRAPVSFSLSNTLGGQVFSSGSTTDSATSDPVTGNASTNVLSGTFSTAVNVKAEVCSDGVSTVAACTAPILSTQSDQLLISTGIAAQDSFSLSASTHNIEGWLYDGVTTTLTARLADHFHNPVPDGTAVYFTSEGGSVTPSCNTVGGVCSAVLTTQALRPGWGVPTCPNGCGRVTVLARATGEEAFIDLSSNGTVDSGVGPGSEMIDANNVSTDKGEAYVDYNENGVFDPATEPPTDFNTDGVYNGTTTGVGGVGGTATGDGKYNGVLCTAGAAICSAQKSIDVRDSQVIIFSDSWGDGTLSHFHNSTYTAITSIKLTSCTTVSGATSVPSNVTVTVVDSNGNAMPAGSTVTFSTTNGTTVSPNSWVVPDTIGCRGDGAGNPFPGCPAFAADPKFGDITVSLVSDATVAVDATSGASTCNNTLSGGVLTVEVATPKGNKTTYNLQVTD